MKTSKERKIERILYEKYSSPPLSRLEDAWIIKFKDKYPTTKKQKTENICPQFHNENQEDQEKKG
jgi:hypothetical protein